MRKQLYAFVLVGVFGIGSVFGADDSADGWKRIFDGKTLKGWKASERPEGWTVEDGVLVGRGSRTHLFYVAEEFDNFEFKADILTQPKTNSGIYFHSKYQEGGWPRNGHEVQVNVSHRDPVKTGSIYNVVKVYQTPAKDKEWWTQTIRVSGQNVRVTINDQLVVDYTEPPGVTLSRRIDKGLFALQQHDPGSVVRYRNIMVRRLPASN